MKVATLPKVTTGPTKQTKTHTNVSGGRRFKRTLTSWLVLLSSACLGRHRPKLSQFPSYCECIQVSRIPGSRNVHENGAELIVVVEVVVYRRQIVRWRSRWQIDRFVDS